MINSEVILAGCRAYVRATGSWARADPDAAEQVAQALASGTGGLDPQWHRGAILAAIAAGVDADRHMPVTAQPL